MKLKPKEQINAELFYLNKIENLYSIVEELYVREFSNNVLVNLSWDELCDEGIKLFEELKEEINCDNVS